MEDKLLSSLLYTKLDNIAKFSYEILPTFAQLLIDASVSVKNSILVSASFIK